MLPRDWSELQPLLDKVLEVPPADRAALMVKLAEGNSSRLADLEQLVTECSAETDFMKRPAGEQFAGLFADDPEPPPPESLGGYRLEREIGRGGMARVYLGDDAKHSRRVAVKVIRSELAASLGRERFLREISIAARLRHPNIVPLYDSGDDQGMLYFVMPYEVGPSLRERMTAGTPLTVDERVSVLRDIARALAYAHEQGVVHRDVKPDNVMLSGGAAVVTDFGISKAVSSAQGENAGNTLTQSGAGIGTPAYMAPEQAVGDPATDHRADIYSFGCLAYELFAGRPPFSGKTSHEMISAHLRSTPDPVEGSGTAVPLDIAALIGRCLQKDPNERPQSAQDLVTALETRRALEPSPKRTASKRAVVLIVSVIALALAGVGLYMKNTGEPLVPGPGDRTVAILPLISAGPDSVQQELALGLSDEIATALFRVSGIRVVSRRGSANYRGQRDVDPAKIGKELGARFLVMGSLREVAGRLVVLVQLIDAPDGTMLWSDRFDRVQAELGPVRDEIARAVGDTLHRILGISGSSVASTTQRAVDPEAYRLYVLAQRALDRRGLSIQTSADLFRRAAEIDTGFAKAYSGLSMAVALSPFFRPISPGNVAAEATRNAVRALALDSTLAQPHIALGLVYQFASEWDRAGNEFRRAISLDGRDVEARVQYGRHLLFRDRPREALTQFLAARNEDPASAVVLSWVSYAYYVEGQTDSAVAESRRAYQSDSTNTTTLALGSLVLLKAGNKRDALRFIAKGQPTNETVYYVLAATGDTAQAMARLRAFELNAPRRWRAETNRFFAMLGAGDTASALSALERATDAKEIWPTLLSSRDPIFDPVRTSERFQNLLVRVGIK